MLHQLMDAPVDRLARAELTRIHHLGHARIGALSRHRANVDKHIARDQIEPRKPRLISNRIDYAVHLEKKVINFFNHR